MSAGGWLILGCSDDGDARGPGAPGPLATPRGGPELCAGGFTSGTFVRTVPFDGEGPAALGVATGAGLDGRLYDDLSTLVPGEPVTPTARFYVRTRYPDRLDPAAPWRLRIDGLVDASDAPGGITLGLEDLAPRVGPRGVHLLECSGNGAGAFFGMVSAADWDGVPLAALLEARAMRRPPGARVLVSGFDDHSQPSARSTPGASWIFSLAELAETGAFLATRMNGEPLTPDHGFPLRLVVPGYYGCTCIKWVDHITFVEDAAPATSHMQEFASRTMQAGTPLLARDYLPAAIDRTAMPVRVEEWNVGGRTVHRVLGIAWGGRGPASALSLRMNDELPFEPVGMCVPVAAGPVPTVPPGGPGASTWSWWSYAFEAPRSGPYRMRLRVDEPGVRTRRLDSAFYARTVTLRSVS